MRFGTLAVLLLSSAGFSQDTPDARALLNESGKALHDYKSYVIEHEVVVEMQGGAESRLEMPVKLAASSPDKLRIESNGQLGSTLIVSDGENTWMYIGPFKQYTKTPAASSPEALMKSMNPGIGQMLEDLKSKDPYLSAKILGGESLQVSGKKFDCYVLEAVLDTMHLPGAMTLSDAVMKMWIDKNSKIVLKQTTTATIQGEALPTPAHMSQSTTVTSLKLNEPLADSMFKFTPPEGAKEVTEFKGPVKATADLTGKVAADFKLNSVDGKEYSLQSLHGKVVLLDFWATWCVPCRNDMPALQKVYQDFRDKGLVMLGMDVGEDQNTVDKFLLGTKLSYPIVLAGDADVVQDYKVTAFPTVVLIDSEGKIAMYHVGSGSDKQLRAALAKLGLSASPASDTR